MAHLDLENKKRQRSKVKLFFTLWLVWALLFAFKTSLDTSFELLFIKAVKSRYADTFSFKSEVNQEEAVAFGLDSTDYDERAIMEEVQEYLTRHPDLESPSAFMYNPCDYGFCFDLN